MNTANNALPMAVNSINKVIVDTEVTPIYPVRYAYANFFEETLHENALPTDLNTLLHARTIKDGQGYIVRLLREGWVYLFDEDNPATDLLHIFKYEKRKSDKGVATEHFVKYKFKNGVDASQGIEVDTRKKCKLSDDGSYGFVFASREVKKVSIVYTEHELAKEVIDKLQSQQSFRRECMQLIDLQKEDGQDFVPATEINLWKLVEDYRERKERFLKFQASTEADQNEISLDVLTTDDSYELDASYISLLINHTLRFSKQSKIVALFDPVGRQKDIALAHAQLCILQQAESAQNIYPYTIGAFVQALRSSKDEVIKEALAENINWQEHGRYWQAMDKRQRTYLARQQEFVDLYSAFMEAAPHQNQVGSLNTYLQSFFAEPQQDAGKESELVKVCDIYTDMFAGMLASAPGNKAFEQLFIAGAEQADSNSNTSPIAIFWHYFLRPIVTQPQKGTDFTANTLRALDRLMVTIAPLISKLYSPTKVSLDYAKKLFGVSAGAGINYIANKVVPAILNAYGIQILDKTVSLTEPQLEKLLNQVINDSNLNHNLHVTNPQTAERYVGSAERKIKLGQAAFDWVEGVKDAKLPTLITLSEIQVDARHYNNYEFVHSPYSEASKIALLVDGSFAGLSAFFNLSAINDLIHQNRFDITNPLKNRSTFQSVMTWTSVLSALTVDIATIGSDTLKLGAKVQPKLLQPQAMQKLSSQATRLSKSLSEFVTGKVAARLILVANITGGISSSISSLHAFNMGSDEEGVGYLAISAGSFILAGQAMLYGAGGTAATGALPISLVLTVVGLIAIGAGATVAFIHGKNDVELLLSCCFWGSSEKYPFWDKGSKYNPFDSSDARPAINKRLPMAYTVYDDKKIADAYKVELQEFENLFNRPVLALEHKTGQSDFHFTLPNFKQGISQLHFKIMVNRLEQADDVATIASQKGGSEIYTVVPEEASALTKQLKEQLNALKSDLTSGLATFMLSLQHEHKNNVTLYWYYEPSPNSIVPKRYLVENEVLDDAIIGMIDNDFMPN
ncbi:hypothetical protein P20652_0097 [Pseudoalteromonas sp. BSi20652]|uniref:toxin VasX n=1 Tax=Pseudoalteromonas sp. BSi20652 TaxID=388384 RepID=UPI0002319615|nr:toxin VasX [Pseudoalteromonas sp. BSi20652]GAA58246.1 hypothetical protein P20652_0097 [Pseudoalteromonas sp. BSi20652]